MSKYRGEIEGIKKVIVKNFQPEKIILFGSYAWGKPKEESDVDLLIIKKSRKKRIDRAREVRKTIMKTGVPVEVLVYTPSEIKERIELEDPFIENILKQGKILYSQG